MFTWDEWLTFFFLYAFVGWIWESCYVSVMERHLVNRGFLRLPLIPLYGFGAITMLVVTQPLPDMLWLKFTVGALGATAMEYVTGVVMERLFKIKYWDYTGHRFHYRGYICLEATLLWGTFTILLTELVHPQVVHLLRTYLNVQVNRITLVFMSALFVADVCISVKAALDMRMLLEKMELVWKELEQIQEQMGSLRREASEWITEKRDIAEEFVQNRKQEHILALLQKKQELVKKKEELFSVVPQLHQHILRSNPSATSRWFSVPLREMQHRFGVFKPFSRIRKWREEWKETDEKEIPEQDIK